MKHRVALSLLAMIGLFGSSVAQYAGWQHSGSLFILTSPDGANIPAAASETGFPLLVRLDKDFFTFSQAQATGADIRFATPSGTALPFQIDSWDAVKGSAEIWVRIPTITGNARQEIKIYWGNATTTSGSNGAAVFSSTNGFAAVMHLADPTKDEVNNLAPVNVNTTTTYGMIGTGRHCAFGQGITCGTAITTLPLGSSPHTISLWLRAEECPGIVLGWGKWTPYQMQVMYLRAPPHVVVDGHFSDAGLAGKTSVPMSHWVHAALTYGSTEARIYLNGMKDTGRATTGTLVIPSGSRFDLGGFAFQGYTFVGDLDEARFSTVARSANWVKMEYENQKPLQTMVGPVVTSGTAFSVSPTLLTVLEGKSSVLQATAGGAQKLYWVVSDNGQKTVVAADRFTFTYLAPRVAGTKKVTLQLQAGYPTGVRTQDVAVTIQEDIPDPVFTLNVPDTWNGRDSISITPVITNLNAMQAKGAGKLNYVWSAKGIAVATNVVGGTLTLKRAQGNGNLAISLSMENGGAVVTREALIKVQQPATDAWVVRAPAANEKPVDSQLYSRDDKNLCTIYYKGSLTTAPDSVYLKVYSGTALYQRLSQKLVGGAYSFAPTIAPRLVDYRFEFGSKTGGIETLLNTVNSVVCGDAYLIDGQSNAEATGFTEFGPDDDTVTSKWIRSYGRTGKVPGSGWSRAVHKSSTGQGQVGYWGLELARDLMTKHNVPICVINGAVGGTRIDEHQRNNANPTDTNTIYGRLLTRVRDAKLTHGIRGVLWHQGENNSGSAAPSPTGDWDYVLYQKYFVAMASDWKQDYPNIRYYYLYQVYPLPCAMGPKGDQIREAQRTLSYLFSNMSVMPTVGVTPAGRGSCHFPCAVYQQFANLMLPHVKRDNYGVVPTADITAPDLKKAYYASAARNEIALVFGQPMSWNSAATVNFFLDKVGGKVTGGSAYGTVIKLALSGTSTATVIDYVRDSVWNGEATNLLKGANGIVALTFADVPIAPDNGLVATNGPGNLPDLTPVALGVMMHKGQWSIACSRPKGELVTLEVITLRGQVVLRKSFEASGRDFVGLPAIKRGMYLVKMSVNAADIVRKFVVF